MDAKPVYICERCDTVHEYEYRAEECCRPEVYQEWQCAVCGEIYTTKELADACCRPADAPEVTARCPLTQDMFGVQS